MDFRFKKSSEILSTMIDNTLVNTNKVNDFTQGSILRTLYEAVAVDLESFYYLTVENILGGIQTSILDAFDFTPLDSRKAHGILTITFPALTTDEIVVPYGAKFTSTDSNYPQVFSTLESFTIPSGVDTAEITVYCDTEGTYGNIPAGTINSFTNVTGASSVTNLTAFQTGTDEEDIDETLIRFRKYIQSLSKGTNQALEYLATTVGTVTNAYSFEQPGYVTLYAHDANGDLTDDDLDLLLANIDDWRPAGIPVDIKPVNKSIVDIQVNLSVSDSSLLTDTFSSKVGENIVKYINSYAVGNDLYVNNVVSSIMNINNLGITNADINIIVYPDEELRDTTQVTNSNSIILGNLRIPYDSLRYRDTSNATSFSETTESTFTTTRDTTDTSTTPTTTNSEVGLYGKGVIDLGDIDSNSADNLGSDTTVTGVKINRLYATKPNEILKAGTITVNFI